MNERAIKAVADAIADHCYGHDEVWRAAALDVLAVVKSQLEAAAETQRFHSDKDGMFVGAEEIGDWIAK